MTSSTNPVTRSEEMTDIHCNTKIMSKKCSFLWTIDQYSAFIRKNTYLTSPSFSAVGDDLKWRLKHSEAFHNGYSLNNLTLELVNYDADIVKYASVNADVEISVLNADNSKAICKKATFSTDSPRYSSYYNHGRVDPKSCHFESFATCSEIRQYVSQDRLTILCEVEYFKGTDVVHVFNSSDIDSTTSSQNRLSGDLERFFNDRHFTDATISIKDKTYPVHRGILASRCSVFHTMFKNNANDIIIIEDIEQEIFEEILYYIYTGKTKNLNECAFQVLPVAEKYDLKELRIMCEEILLKKLSVDNAIKILILAHVHHAEQLKTHTLRFIKAHYSKFEDFKNKKIWNTFTTSHFELMNEMLASFCDSF